MKERPSSSASPREGQSGRAGGLPPPPSVRERVLVLGGLATVVGVLLVVGFLFWPQRTRQLLALMPFAFFILGKLLPGAGYDVGIVPALGGVSIRFSAYELALVIALMDLATALVMAYGFEALRSIEAVGRRLDSARETARAVLEANKWMARVAILGVTLFVCFPVTGTGAIGATFLGSMLGMSRVRIILCIAIGAMAGSFGMAFLLKRMGDAARRLQNNPWFILLMVAVVVILLWWLKRTVKKKALKPLQPSGEGSPPPRTPPE